CLPVKRLPAGPGDHLDSRRETTEDYRHRPCGDKAGNRLRAQHRRDGRHCEKTRSIRDRSPCAPRRRSQDDRDGVEVRRRARRCARRGWSCRSFAPPRRNPGDPVSEATLVAVGDVAPDREDPRECFSRTRDLLSSAHFAFCQLETSLADKGVRALQARNAVLTRPDVAPAMREAGFTAVSFAGNHCLDWGNEAFFETIRNVTSAGMHLVGAGANIGEARRPVIQEANGVRIAFLAYSTILPQAYWAEASRPGCAPMRAHTVYEAIEHDQPGTPARIHTFPHREDLAAMCADLRAAKEQADVVAVSHHWGIHFVPYVLADYQPDVGRAAIDAGADMVLGHHAHILKGIEVYRGKPIFYSLCNFATDLRMDEAHAS